MKTVSRIKLLVKSLHPSNRLRVAAGNAVTVSQDRLGSRVVVEGQRNRVTIENSVRLRNMSISISGSDNILTIDADSMLKDCRIELFGDGNRISLGRGCTVNGGFVGAHWGTTIRVGDGCLFAEQIDVRTTDSHSILDKDGRRINPDANVEIGDRVWLARGASVLKGSVIANDVVVGAMAVVTRSIPPRSIVAGVPAQVIRSDVCWSTERL